MHTATEKRLSCGIVILNRQQELLLCHVTGYHHWDLPKGGIDDGETPLDAALRETREETGLRLDGDELIDLGRFDYRPRKDLHLYAALMPRVDPASLECTSRFADRLSGQRLPEMDDFRWAELEQIPSLCTRWLSAVLLRRIDLARVLDELSARPALPAAALPTLASRTTEIPCHR